MSKVKRERETRAQQLMSGIPWETVTLTTLSRDRNLFYQLLTEARDIAMRGQEGKLVIHTPWGIEWKPFGLPRRKRPLKSVVLQDGISETVQNDITAFLQRRQWYADRGMYLVLLQLADSDNHRYSLSTRISPSRTTGIWQVFIHSSTCRVIGIRHLSPQFI